MKTCKLIIKPMNEWAHSHATITKREIILVLFNPHIRHCFFFYLSLLEIFYFPLLCPLTYYFLHIGHYIFVGSLCFQFRFWRHSIISYIYHSSSKLAQTPILQSSLPILDSHIIYTHLIQAHLSLSLITIESINFCRRAFPTSFLNWCILWTMNGYQRPKIWKGTL